MNTTEQIQYEKILTYLRRKGFVRIEKKSEKYSLLNYNKESNYNGFIFNNNKNSGKNISILVEEVPSTNNKSSYFYIEKKENNEITFSEFIPCDFYTFYGCMVYNFKTILDNNVIYHIECYKEGNTYFFDNPDKFIKHEAFVLGTSELLINFEVPDSQKHLYEKNIFVEFSEYNFYDKKTDNENDRINSVVLEKMRSSKSGQGAWYKSIYGENWLCPTTLKYFDNYPEKIYIRIINKNIIK